MRVSKFLLVIVLLLVAKEITAWRAHNFIMECLSAEQVDMVVSKEINQQSIDEQREFVGEAISCVQERQTYFEVVISEALGTFLFYRPWR
jgi:hypothetical protein